MTTVEMTNDLVTIGEDAARAFRARDQEKLKEHIEPMALGLAEAKQTIPGADCEIWRMGQEAAPTVQLYSRTTARH